MLRAARSMATRLGGGHDGAGAMATAPLFFALLTLAAAWTSGASAALGLLLVVVVVAILLGSVVLGVFEEQSGWPA